jgi:hypothetical protein
MRTIQQRGHVRADNMIQRAPGSYLVRLAASRPESFKLQRSCSQYRCMYFSLEMLTITPTGYSAFHAVLLSSTRSALVFSTLYRLYFMFICHRSDWAIFRVTGFHRDVDNHIYIGSLIREGVNRLGPPFPNVFSNNEISVYST